MAYILNLLVSLIKLNPEEAKKRQKEIIGLVAGELQSRSKRQLIEEFIENLLKLKPNYNVSVPLKTIGQSISDKPLSNFAPKKTLSLSSLTSYCKPINLQTACPGVRRS